MVGLTGRVRLYSVAIRSGDIIPAKGSPVMLRRANSSLLPVVMEYLGGGEIKWRTNDGEPVLRVDQTRRICRDVILGLEYCAFYLCL